MNHQLYVMPCFLKPGKQAFIVQSKVFETDMQVNKAKAVNMLASLDNSSNSQLNSALDGKSKNRIINMESTSNEDALTEEFFFH